MRLTSGAAIIMEVKKAHVSEVPGGPAALPPALAEADELRREIERLRVVVARDQTDAQLLSGLTDAVAQSRTLEEIYEHALDAVTKGLSADRASILLFDDSGSMRFRAWRGLSAQYRQAVDGHSPWAATETAPTPVLVADAVGEPAMAPYAAIFAAEGIRALAFFPVMHQGKLLGKFMVYFDQPRELSEHEVRLALAIGSQVAHGIARRIADDEIRRLLDEATRAHAAAEQAVKSRDALLAVVSHDLRNPINTLSLSANALGAKAAAAGNERLRPHIQVMQRALGTMNRLVSDLLDVSAVEAGALQVRPLPVPVQVLIDRALELLQPQASDREQQLLLDVSGDTVMADQDRIVQALLNIVGNAIKFTPVGGTIRIGVRPLAAAADAAEPSRQVEVAVSDTGPGIAPEHLPRIFDRFWQARDRRHGVGLGLAIARGIVEAHGGQIRAESALGQGASFTFTLRVA